MNHSATPRYVFQEGDHALLVDRKGRRYLVRLSKSGKFESHIGNFDHQDLIDCDEGTWVTTARGHRLLAVKPTMAEFTQRMPRIATVVYPKDLGAFLIYADIFPGCRVLEAGTGSGAVTIALLRAVGDTGHVFSYDTREDMIRRATSNVEVIYPEHANLTIRLGDVYQGFEEREIDRIVLDLPEPWHLVSHASEALVPGGIILSFLPTVLQIHDLVNALKAQLTFEMIETFEIMLRPWSVSGRSVRPAHQMVAHTGFITIARRVSPRPRGTRNEDSSTSEDDGS